MSPTDASPPAGTKSKRRKGKKTADERRFAELDRKAEEMLGGGKRGEIMPVWVKSSPIVVMDTQVSLQMPPEPTKMEHAASMVDVQVESLLLHEQLWGRDNPRTIKFAERLIKTCNRYGTSVLGLGDTRTALLMFQKASEVLGSMPAQGDYATKLELRCLTYSNLAWFHFITKDFTTALRYAQKSHSSANMSKDQRAMAAAHLNVGCCISMLGKHEVAMDHATKALYLLQAEHGGMGSNSAVAVCLHNIGVQQINMYRTGEGTGAGEALESVTDAIEIAKEVLDDSHTWLKHFKRTFKVALKMSPSVDTLRKSGLGPLKRVRSPATQILPSNATMGRSQSRKAYTPDGSQLPKIASPAIDSSGLAPMKGGVRLSETDLPAPVIAPPQRKPTAKLQPLKVSLPNSLSQPHAFNGSPTSEADPRPESRAAILGLGHTTHSVELGDELQQLVKARTQMINEIGTKPVLEPLVQSTTKSETTVVTATLEGYKPEGQQEEDMYEGEEKFEEDEPEDEYADDDFAEEGAAEPEVAAEEEDYGEDEGFEEEEEYREDEFDADEEVATINQASDGEQAAVDKQAAIDEQARAEAASRIQRITRGRQGRKKAIDKRAHKISAPPASKIPDADELAREQAALKIQSLTRGKSGRKKALMKKKKAHSGVSRSDLGDGGNAGAEIDRQRAALRIQSQARARKARKEAENRKNDPNAQTQGYKQFSEYHGEEDHPYNVKLKQGKKGAQTHVTSAESASLYQTQSDYSYSHQKAALAIQAAQRGKVGRRKAKTKRSALGPPVF